MTVRGAIVRVTANVGRGVRVDVLVQEHAQRAGSQIGHQNEQRQATRAFGKRHARGPTKDRDSHSLYTPLGFRVNSGA